MSQLQFLQISPMFYGILLLCILIVGVLLFNKKPKVILAISEEIPPEVVTLEVSPEKVSISINMALKKDAKLWWSTLTSTAKKFYANEAQITTRVSRLTIPEIIKVYSIHLENSLIVE